MHFGFAFPEDFVQHTSHQCLFVCVSSLLNSKQFKGISAIKKMIPYFTFFVRIINAYKTDLYALYHNGHLNVQGFG